MSCTFTTGLAPTVTGRTPASGATGVSRTANITATFSENVPGISTTTVKLATTTGTAVTYNATSRVVTLDPSTTLLVNTKYRGTSGIPRRHRQLASHRQLDLHNKQQVKTRRT